MTEGDHDTSNERATKPRTSLARSMNCPTRVDPEALPNGWNQNPDIYAAMRGSDTDSTANKLRQRSHRIDPQSHNVAEGKDPDEETGMGRQGRKNLEYSEVDVDRTVSSDNVGDTAGPDSGSSSKPNSQTALSEGGKRRHGGGLKAPATGVWRVLCKYAKFVGPGWMVSVAYIDPGQLCSLTPCSKDPRLTLGP